MAWKDLQSDIAEELGQQSGSRAFDIDGVRDSADRSWSVFRRSVRRQKAPKTYRRSAPTLTCTDHELEQLRELLPLVRTLGIEAKRRISELPEWRHELRNEVSNGSRRSLRIVKQLSAREHARLSYVARLTSAKP